MKNKQTQFNTRILLLSSINIYYFSRRNVKMKKGKQFFFIIVYMNFILQHIPNYFIFIHNQTYYSILSYFFVLINLLELVARIGKFFRGGRAPTSNAYFLNQMFLFYSNFLRWLLEVFWGSMPPRICATISLFGRLIFVINIIKNNF